MRHVALNAAYLDPGRSSGTETYLRGLAPAIARLVPELTILTTRRGARALAAEGWGDFATVVALRADEGQRVRRLRAELLGVARAAADRGADVLHSLANTGPVRSAVPHVLTLHDVNWLSHATLPAPTRLVLRAIVPPAARAAAAVITGSEAARRDVAAAVGLSPEAISVIHHGGGRPAAATAPAPADAVRAALDLPADARVVLSVGVVRRHKNQALLVRALDHLPEDVVLVLAGAHEAYADEVRALAGPRVRMPGYLADDVLEGLWGLASCAAFPTRGEGFGLPLLEAMAREVPVACSDIAVLREVGGEVPRYFDPDDAPGAARAIELAMSEGPAGASERAALFTWEAAAARYVEVYERACTSG